MKKTRVQINVGKKLHAQLLDHCKQTDETLTGFFVRAAQTTMVTDNEQSSRAEVTMTRPTKPGCTKVLLRPFQLPLC